MKGVSYDEAEAAKTTLASELAGLPELRGIGIAVLDEGFGVKVNLRRRLADRIVPTCVGDVPVIVDIVDTIPPLQKREEPTIEFWIAPDGAAPPMATPTVDPRDVKPAPPKG